MDQYKQHKWMVIKPIELKHPTFNLANNSAKNRLRIWIYEQIWVTTHLDTHRDTHSDHVFLTNNIFWAIFSGKHKRYWKFWHMGFVKNRPISITMRNFCKIQIHLGENRGCLKPMFPEIVVGHFLNSFLFWWVVVTTVMNLYF